MHNGMNSKVTNQKNRLDKRAQPPRQRRQNLIDAKPSTYIDQRMVNKVKQPRVNAPRNIVVSPGRYVPTRCDGY